MRATKAPPRDTALANTSDAIAGAGLFNYVGCNICHVGKKKTNRNVYGKALAKLLKEGDDKDIPKIKSALEAVAQEPSNPKKPESPTFGQRIKSGKLPKGWTLERDPSLLETNIPGVFAVGDVLFGSVKRVASSVGEGSVAIQFVHQYLSNVS